MKTTIQFLILGLFATLLWSCSNSPVKEEQPIVAASPEAATGGGQGSVRDDESSPNVVKVAVGSPDHTTLVKAVQAAGLVDVLSNNGPFTVFAPTNKAFDNLPPGTVDELLKPEKLNDLKVILQYHVAAGIYQTAMLKDGQALDMAYGGKTSVGVKDGKVTINGANVVASIHASNGIVHVIDAVLLPPAQ